MDELIAAFLGSHGLSIQILSIVGLLRLVIKPIMEIISAYVAHTESKSDDAFLDKIIKSSLYSKVLFILDYLASIKVKK